MKCHRCGTELPAGARFCPGCGHAVGGAALAPTSLASPATYIPRRLAEKILSSRAALEGERKQVTVLFADLKSSLELLADRDPEEARALLDPVLEHMMEAVHRYEGTVSQILGDGIMALFGAPVAHEDHAVRACYAALRMQESVKTYADEMRRSHGTVVRIRVGLNSGQVVVRAIGNDLHMDYTAVGQTTHLAARMEQLADPGAILITPETLALAEGYVEVKPLGPVPVKGLAGPVEVYEVTGTGPARTRLQASARRGLTRFVGREVELEQLRRAQQLAGDGYGQVAAIVGESGVGKSRLVYELTHSHRQEGWLVLESAAVSYGRATSYSPVIDLLKGYFKIQDRDDVREIREKVTGKLLALDETLAPERPALLALLDVAGSDAVWAALDPGQRRRRTLDAVTRLLLREAREQPVLLIVEDLHWIDGETQALLDELLDGLGSARMFLLVNYRPEYRSHWGKTYHREIRLDALPTASAGELVDALLGEDPELAPLKQLLVTRGNPFFLEETVRTLVETRILAGQRGRYRLMQPIQTVQVPPTVQVMLAARIDRLALEDKRLLQVASVVGKDVPFALLQGIADLPDDTLRQGLDRLQSAEFLYETGLYPDLQYSFAHAVTHDVTYGGLLHERRRELHASIVGVIETHYQDRLGEQVERLAHHAVHGDLREKAVDYLRQAGGKATARSALPDARVWFQQAVAVLEALPESRWTLEQAFEIRCDLRPVLVQLGEVRGALQRLREAEGIADRLSDDRRRGRVSALMTNTHSMLGDPDAALETGARALDMAERLGDMRLRILATTYLEQARYWRGDHERVVELATRNLAGLPADWVYEYFGAGSPPSIYDRCWLVLSLAELGRFAQAVGPVREAIRLADPMHHAHSIGWAYRTAGTLHVLKGDWARARSLIEHAIAVIRSGNVALLLPDAVSAGAWVLAQLGEASEASSWLGEGQQLVERQAGRGVGILGRAYHSLAQASLALGRLDEARRLADRAVECSQRQPGYAAHALHLIGSIATHPDRFEAERGEAHFRRALALAEARGMRPVIAHCHLGLGKLYRHEGDRAKALEHLTLSTKGYLEMGMHFWLDKAEAEVAAIPG